MPGKTIDISEIKDIYTASAFWGDGKGMIEITTDLINKIESGEGNKIQRRYKIKYAA